MNRSLITFGLVVIMIAGCVQSDEADATEELGESEYPLAGDCAQFVSDVNYPDYTNVAKGTTITKKWKIKNCGTTTWTPSYWVIKESGTAGFCVSFHFTSNTSPGATADVWATCTVPNSTGKKEAYFKVANPSSVKFGSLFWVIVNAV